MISLLEWTRRVFRLHTFEETVSMFGQKGWYHCETSHTSMAHGVMQSELARMMGRPIIHGATQSSPPLLK